TYFLKAVAVERLPRLLEQFARLRGMGAGVLARGEATLEERGLLLVRTEEIATGLRDMRESLEKVISLHPELRDALHSSLAQLHARGAEMERVIQALVYRGERPM